MKETLKFCKALKGSLIELRYRIGLQEELVRHTRELLDEIDDTITERVESERKLKIEKTPLCQLVKNDF